MLERKSKRLICTGNGIHFCYNDTLMIMMIIIIITSRRGDVNSCGRLKDVQDRETFGMLRPLIAWSALNRVYIPVRKRTPLSDVHARIVRAEPSRRRVRSNYPVWMGSSALMIPREWRLRWAGNGVNNDNGAAEAAPMMAAAIHRGRPSS